MFQQNSATRARLLGACLGPGAVLSASTWDMLAFATRAVQQPFADDRGASHEDLLYRVPWWGPSLVAPWPNPAPTLGLTSPFATRAACLWSGVMLLVLLDHVP